MFIYCKSPLELKKNASSFVVFAVLELSHAVAAFSQHSSAEHEEVPALEGTAQGCPPQARILPAWAAGYQLLLCGRQPQPGWKEGDRPFCVHCWAVVTCTVTVRQCRDSSRVGSPAEALAVALQQNQCAQVSPALRLLLQSSEIWVAAQTGQNASLAKGRLVRAKLACRLLILSHF